MGKKWVGGWWMVPTRSNRLNGEIVHYKYTQMQLLVAKYILIIQYVLFINELWPLVQMLTVVKYVSMFS